MDKRRRDSKRHRRIATSKEDQSAQAMATKVARIYLAAMIAAARRISSKAGLPNNRFDELDE